MSASGSVPICTGAMCGIGVAFGTQKHTYLDSGARSDVHILTHIHAAPNRSFTSLPATWRISSKLPAWKRDMVLKKRAEERERDPNFSTVFPGARPGYR